MVTDIDCVDDVQENDVWEYDAQDYDEGHTTQSISIRERMIPRTSAGSLSSKLTGQAAQTS